MKDLREEINSILLEQLDGLTSKYFTNKLLSLFKQQMKEMVKELPTGMFDSTPYKEEILNNIESL